MSLVLIDLNCGYTKLVDTIMTEFGLDPAKVAVTMKYILNSDLPSITIKSDNNVLSYIALKDIDCNPSKYPIHIEVTAATSQKQPIAVLVVGPSKEHGFSLTDMTSNICGAIVEPSSDNFEDEKEIMKLSLSFYAIQHMFEYMVVRSDKKDYLVKCSCDEYRWICRASKLAKTDMFKIRHIVEGHTCVANIILSTHRQLTKTVVSTCIKYKCELSHTIYRPNDIRNDMLHSYGISLNYVQAWRSREQTLKMLKGDPTDSFNKLPGFFAILQQTNPGTVTSLEIDGHNRFKYCFMALGASIRGWKHCRPVVVVNGTYLNEHYGGTLFTACTQDANNNIFVLAFGIGDNENDSSWSWFFRQLKKAYGDREGLCFVSDRHNSIKNAIEIVYPGTCHGICSYHLLQNLKSHYRRSGQNITKAFNAAVRAYTLSEYEYHMQQLDLINEKIRGYLDGVGPRDGHDSTCL